MIGQGALQGHFEWAWLWAWAQQRLTLEGTLLLRQRLLYGALRIDPESVRHGGVGYFLDQVLDVEALEGLVLSGGFAALLAGVKLTTASLVLYLGVGGGLQMVGHRTRLAQEAPSRRHADEGRLLVRYLKASERRDASQLFLGNAIPQAWLLLGLAWLSYQALNQPTSATTLAVSVGGVLLAWVGILGGTLIWEVGLLTGLGVAMLPLRRLRQSNP